MTRIRPACPRACPSPTRVASCDGAGNCNNMAKANGKPCTAGGQCSSTFCIDGYCCNSGCAQTCYQCNKAGAIGTCSAMAGRLAGPQRDHAVRHVDAVLQRVRLVPDQQEAERSDLHRRPPIAAATTASTASAAAARARAPASRARWRARSVAASICRPGRRTRWRPRRAVARRIATRPGLARRASSRTAACARAGAECGSNKCVDGVCCNATCTEACYTCNLPGGTPGECVGLATGAMDPACPGANYCDAMHRCTSGKKPNGATCAADTECASNACVDGTCCESACSGKCRSCKNATGTCAMAGDGTDPREECKGTGVCTGDVQRPGRLPLGSAGDDVLDGRLPERRATSATSASATAPATASRRRRADCMGFACYTDPADKMAKCKTSCFNDPDCAQKRYCPDPNDGGASRRRRPGDGDSGVAVPAGVPAGARLHAQHAVSVEHPQRWRLLQRELRQVRQLQHAGHGGDVHPDPGRHRSGGRVHGQRQRSDGQCARGFCSGQCALHLSRRREGRCGTCKTCNGSGLCNVKPDDDTTCGDHRVRRPRHDLPQLPRPDHAALRVARRRARRPNTVATLHRLTNPCTCGAGGGSARWRGGGGGGATGSRRRHGRRRRRRRWRAAAARSAVAGRRRTWHGRVAGTRVGPLVLAAPEEMIAPASGFASRVIAMRGR